MKKSRVFAALGLAAVIIIGSAFSAFADDVKSKEVEYESMKKRIQYLYDKAEEYRAVIEEQNNAIQELADKQNEDSSEEANVETSAMHTANAEAAKAQAAAQAASDAQAAADEALAQAEAEAEAVHGSDRKAEAAATQAMSEAMDAQETATAEAAAAVQATAKAQAAAAAAQAEAEEMEKARKHQCTDSELRQQLVKYALSWVGVTPYVWAGNSLTSGTDCSGFVNLVYSYFKIDVPRSSYAFRSFGDEVSYEDAKPGDIICYDGHVALYIGGGAVVHASDEATGTKITDDANYREILTVRRVI